MVQTSQALPLAVSSKGPSFGVRMKVTNQLGYGARESEMESVVSGLFAK
jgi:hypothetical protein